MRPLTVPGLLAVAVLSGCGGIATVDVPVPPGPTECAGYERWVRLADAVVYDYYPAWTGSVLLSVQPEDNTVYAYDPRQNLHYAIAGSPRLEHRKWPVTAWAGERFVVWSGKVGAPGQWVVLDDGVAFDLTTGEGQEIAADPMTPGTDQVPPVQVAVSTAQSVIAYYPWVSPVAPPAGAILDVATRRWSLIAPEGAPPVYSDSSKVWTGSQMIVWGGSSESPTGARYDLAGDTWLPISSDGAPSPRYSHSAVWTGTHMFIWGGTRIVPGDLVDATDGGLYDPLTDTWTDVSTAGAPSVADHPALVWTGDRVIVLGGYNLEATVIGSVYDPATDSWTPVTHDPRLDVADDEFRVTLIGAWDGCRVLMTMGHCSDMDTKKAKDGCVMELWAYEPPPRE